MPALSLSKLVDLALGTPEVGAVNFNILHSLLHAMIQHLKLSDVTADINESDRDFLSGPEKMRLLSSLSGDSGRDDSLDTQSQSDTHRSGTDIRKHRPPYHNLETKVARLAEQLEQLNALPSTGELFQQIKATGDSDRPKPMADLWKTMQINRKVEANEQGVGKLMGLVEDLMREMSALKDNYGRMDDLEAQMKLLKDENYRLKNKIDNLGIQDLLKRLNDLDALTKDLNERFEMLPSAEDFEAYVTWPGLEEALTGVRHDIEELSKFKQPTTGLPRSRSDMEGEEPLAVSRPDSSRPSTRLSATSSGASIQILDVLEKLGKVCGQHDELEERVEVLEDEMKNKVDKDVFEQSLEGLNLDRLDDLIRQLEQMKLDVFNLQNEVQGSRDQAPPATMKPLGVVFDPTHSVSSVHDITIPSKKGSAVLPPLTGSQTPKPVFRESLDTRPGSSDKGRAMGNIAKRVSSLEEQLKALQDFVMGEDEGTGWLEDEGSSEMILAVEEPAEALQVRPHSGHPSRPLTIPYMPELPTRKSPVTPAAEIHNSQHIMSVCAGHHDGDANAKLKNLGKVLNLELRGLKEKLRRRDQDFKKMEKGIDLALKKAARSGASKMDSRDGEGPDMEALIRAQKSIHRLREDVDKLQITTQDILSENDTRTKQIESLFHYSDRLQEIKADKEYVAMEVDVKADKHQLETKVNHSLFETTTDDINKIIQEIQDKLSGNVFGWQDAISKLTEELESKLDRMELKSLKEWLESRLKALNQKIKQSGNNWEDDDAAGLRKQLLQRFHCISCDRPVDIMTGPIQSIPGNAGLPGTRSPRPYTTYELDQIRQHAKSLQGGGGMISSLPYMTRHPKKDHVMGRNVGNYERALAEREMARLRKTDLRKFMIQQYNSEACRGDVEEISGQETADFYGADRPCGGSHTMTYPHKRVTKMSHLNHLFQTEPTIPPPAPVAFKHDSELDILGVDGHIYKGRINKQDPARRHPLMATYQPVTGDDRRPATSGGPIKQTTTPVPPAMRPRPTSAVPRPASGGSITRINSSNRLTMRPQSARPCSTGGSTTPSPPPEEPRQFLTQEEEQAAEEQGRAPTPEPVEVPGDTPREESANVEEE